MMTRTNRSDSEQLGDPKYARELGARLRAMREQRGWSLRDVHDASQGRFTGRPSRLTISVEPEGSPNAGHVKVAGPVALVGEGRLFSGPRSSR